MAADIHEFRKDLPNVSLLGFAYVLTKGRWTIFWSVVVAVTLALGLCLISSKRYAAKVSFVSLAKNPMQSLFGDKLDQFATLSPALGLGNVSRGNTPFYLSLLESSNLLDRLIDKYHLIERYDSKDKFFTRRKLKQYTKTKEEKGGIITLTVTDTDKKIAEQIAADYYVFLNEILNSMSLTEAQKEEQFLAGRLKVAKEELASSLQTMTDFQNENRVIMPQVEVQAGLALSSKIEESLLSERLRLNSLTRVDQPNSQTLQGVQARIRSLEQQLQRLYSSPSKNTGKVGMPSLSSSPQLLADFSRLKLEVELKEKIYELVLKQYEMSRAAAAKEAIAVEIVDKAEALPNAVQPKILLIMLLFTALGLFAGLGIVFTREWWRRLKEAPENRESIEKIKEELFIIRKRKSGVY